MLDSSRAPLSGIAAEINGRFEKTAEADDHRIAVGKLLIAARERVKRGEVGDVTWLDSRGWKQGQRRRAYQSPAMPRDWDSRSANALSMSGGAPGNSPDPRSRKPLQDTFREPLKAASASPR